MLVWRTTVIGINTVFSLHRHSQREWPHRPTRPRPSRPAVLLEYEIPATTAHNEFTMSYQPQGITLSSVVESDFETLLALRIEAMRESLERIGRFDPVRARERFRSGFLPANTMHIVLASVRVGFLVTKLQDQHLLIDHLYIRPAYQGRGIGAEVLKLVFAQAEQFGLPVKVGALLESDSNRFYQRHGFHLIEQSEFDNYYLRSAQATL
jgi:ribosomal protein S18 acetylase RimI-like enzyme